MAGDQPTVIKKYANRRLYHTGTSTYVTLDDLARMVKEGEDFVVSDAKTGEDITRAVLGQIIFEHENRGQHLLPIAFLRQLIRFYGDSMQTLLPTYLEGSLASFTRNQEQLREQMARAFQGDALGMMEEQTRRNMEMFSEAMRLWAPFSAGNNAAKPKP
jgi:polyhydroxyalkanoate synthesis repressor PhaR